MKVTGIILSGGKKIKFNNLKEWWVEHGFIHLVTYSRAFVQQHNDYQENLLKKYC